MARPTYPQLERVRLLDEESAEHGFERMGVTIQQTPRVYGLVRIVYRHSNGNFRVCDLEPDGRFVEWVPAELEDGRPYLEILPSPPRLKSLDED